MNELFKNEIKERENEMARQEIEVYVMKIDTS